MAPNNQPTQPDQLNRIIIAVEHAFGRAPKTPKDFDSLRLSIYERTTVLLSATTLKRLWGYLDEKNEPRRHTLDALCRYAGWKDFDAMEASTPSAESGPLANESIDIANGALKIGDKLTISWLPDREMIVEYQGNTYFKILSALNTRLQPGDTFVAGIIATDQPLYLDHLTRAGVDMGVYVCGRRSGIRFILPRDL